MYSDICPEKCVSAPEGYVKIWHSVRKIFEDIVENTKMF